MKQKWIEGEDYYVNEKGLVTFTAAYLLERGYCCGNGCKHCPYNYEGVPEPKRSHLLATKANSTSNEQIWLQKKPIKKDCKK